MFNNTDKILIAGGSGFIGRHLANRCSEYTPHITCLGLTGNYRGQQKSRNMRFIQADIRNKRQLKSALRNKSFDYVFNLGGYIDHTPYLEDGRKIIESHFTGLMNLIDCLDVKKLKGFVQTGSSDEYGNAPAPQQEGMREKPISPYSFAKTASSHFIQMLSNTEGFPGVVLRLFLVYGPMQDGKRFLPHIIKACLKNCSFKISEGKQLRDFCYVEDVVEALIKAAVLPSAKGHIINVASGAPVSIRQVTEKVVRLTGGGRPLWGAHQYRKGENMALYADISLAKNLLKWEPKVTFEKGLKETIEHYKSFLKGAKL
ncbi:MAG: NAD-dependent epimerase/dehydratase family protein [Nitrospirae bacterium]|nr:NAD-dependent epimerase/dehydratase family protein [Nitrospirota bacterium]